MSTVEVGQSFPVSLVVQETGATHTIDGGGTVDLLRDEDGQPQREYVLLADFGDVQVPLASYNYGRLNTVLASERARAQAKADTTPPPPAA